MAADDEDDDIPAVARPDPAELDYDLDAALSALVCVRAEIPADAFTAAALGTERRGNGVVIGKDGLIVTIGYLITEAQQGRSFEVTPSGEIVWEYVNRYDKDRIAWVHDAETYDPTYFTVTDWSCPAN